MKRRVMQLLFTLGLLLTLAAGTLWVRNVWVMDSFQLMRVRVEPDEVVMTQAIRLDCGRTSFMVTWWSQRIARVISHANPRETGPWGFSHRTMAPGALGPGGVRSRKWWERMGFFRWSGSGLAVEAVGVPSWLVVLVPFVFTVPVAPWLHRDRRRRVRQSKNLCPTCGYDLRGAEHERCPECGGTVPAKVQVAV